MRERLSQLVEAKARGSMTDFARQANISRQSLFDYFAGRNKTVGTAAIVRILEHFTDVSAEWLMRGEGEMFRNGQHCISQRVEVMQSNNNTFNATMQTDALQIEDLKRQLEEAKITITELRADKAQLQADKDFLRKLYTDQRLPQ